MFMDLYGSSKTATSPFRTVAAWMSIVVIDGLHTINA